MNFINRLAWISSLVFGAHDTTAAVMTRSLHVLSQRPDLQHAIREEIRNAQNEGVDMDLDDLMDLPMLDAFLKESMRLFPPLASMPRV